jgi:hypothetical protein
LIKVKRDEPQRIAVSIAIAGNIEPQLDMGCDKLKIESIDLCSNLRCTTGVADLKKKALAQLFIIPGRID